MTCNTYWKNCGCSFHCPSSLRCQFADYLIGILLRMTAFWDHLGSARGISLYNLETVTEWNYMMDFSLIIAALSQWDPFENRCHLKKIWPTVSSSLGSMELFMILILDTLNLMDVSTVRILCEPLSVSQHHSNAMWATATKPLADMPFVLIGSWWNPYCGLL